MLANYFLNLLAYLLKLKNVYVWLLIFAAVLTESGAFSSVQFVGWLVLIVVLVLDLQLPCTKCSSLSFHAITTSWVTDIFFLETVIAHSAIIAVGSYCRQVLVLSLDVLCLSRLIYFLPMSLVSDGGEFDSHNEDIRRRNSRLGNDCRAADSVWQRTVD